MKLILAIVKPFRAQRVLEAVGDLDVDTVLVSEAKGYGRQKDQLPRYIGSEYSFVYLPKIETKILVPDEVADKMLRQICDVARTGRMGDGKLLLLPVDFEIDF